ncbi:MAG: glycoside hydrolase family 57 protein [candidate division WOR-3 bacterium]
MLDLAIVWHFHQPPYDDPESDELILPWVRLHAAKDYLDMLLLLDEFPQVKLNFNFTPCLIQQILGYSQKSDQLERLTQKPAEELTNEEKIAILSCCFQAPVETMIKPYPRYFELLVKRGFDFDPANLQVIRKFQPADFRDLQVLANLVWVDPWFRNQKPISELFTKRRYYTEEDKQIVLKFMREILGRIIDEYRRACQAKRIELLTSPFYHPILPLLCDANSALVANPNRPPPDWDFRFPEDALAQLEQGIAYFEQTFGLRPNGIWLPETAVSEEVLSLLVKIGVQWTIADEKILAKTLSITFERDFNGNLNNGELLCTPYQYEIQNPKPKTQNITILFRDTFLSDLIGFKYGTWDGIAAAEDLYRRIKAIGAQLPANKNYLLVIALDGENPWENYKNDGIDFLRHFYGLLNQESNIKTVRITDYLKTQNYFPVLKNLQPGSWVQGNFDIWSGSEEDSKAWQLLSKTRKDLLTYEKKSNRRVDKAWDEIYKAEASDWFWWFGEEHFSVYDKTFDALFRKHLIQVYRITNQPQPIELEEPIKKSSKYLAVLPKNYIRPIIDGKETNFYEWRDAGYFDLTPQVVTMHPAVDWLKKVWYGFDEDYNFYLRIDSALAHKDWVNRQCKIEFLNLPGEIVLQRTGAYFCQSGKRFDLESACDECYELKIPKGLITLPKIQFVIKLFNSKNELAISKVLQIEMWNERSQTGFWPI